MEPKRIGVFIRVSTDMQVKDDSPEHHEQRARHYAQAKGWDILEVYQLDAVSGKSVMQHPETQRMLRDVKSGHIHGLVFSKLARLARNTIELLEFSSIFRTHNADLISLSESIDTSTPAGRLFYTVIAAMAEWEREEISSRVAASVPIRAKLGKPLGGQAAFGYRWHNKALVLDEAEAPVRRLMYELFIQHQRKFSTATALNDAGYRTRSKSKFTATTVGRLLRDSSAKGERRANYTKSLGDGKQWVIKPESEWVIMPCPQIVSAELWQAVNNILDIQEAKHVPRPKAVYLLSGFVRCDCGKTMYVYHTSKVYACSKCRHRIAVADIDEIFQEHLKEYLKSIDVTLYRSETDKEIEEKTALLERAKKERAKLQKHINALIDLRLNNELSKELFAEKCRPAELQLQQIDAQLPILEAEIDVRAMQLLSSDTVIQEVQTLYDQWETLPFEHKRNIVETIVSSIEIGKEDITITLAYVPSVPQNAKKPSHGVIPVRKVLSYRKVLKRPNIPQYTDTPSTLGEHIRKKRIESRLQQKDVADALAVSEDCITGWENGRNAPQIRHYPRIIAFLGYYPFDHETETIAGKLLQIRFSKGLSIKACAALLCVSEDAAQRWERGKPISNMLYQRLIHSVWTMLPKQLLQHPL